MHRIGESFQFFRQAPDDVSDSEMELVESAASKPMTLASTDRDEGGTFLASYLNVYIDGLDGGRIDPPRGRPEGFFHAA
jgi:hypothetical protein